MMLRWIPIAILRLDGYDKSSVPWRPILYAFLAVMAALSLWRIVHLAWRWWTRPMVSPKRLFRELCDQHALSAGERAMLREIAAEGTFDPNFLFIDPGLWPVTQPERQSLYLKLFGDQAPGANG